MTQAEVLELLAKSQQIVVSQAELNRQLTARIDELLSQIAWLNRQLFGRRSEKLACLDPNQMSLFEPPGRRPKR